LEPRVDVKVDENAGVISREGGRIVFFAWFVVVALISIHLWFFMIPPTITHKAASGSAASIGDTGP
jgi:hypothetical protein